MPGNSKMKSKLTSLALAASSIVANAQNPKILEQIENNYQSGRVRTEFNSINDVETLRTTIGTSANPKNYTDFHSSVSAAFESFRLNQDYNFDSKDSTTSLGTLLPLKFEGFNTLTLLFGSVGEKNGIGLEETISIGNVSPSFSFEKNLDNSSTRLGGEVEVKTGKFKSAIGFDNISQDDKEDINQFHTRTVYDLTKADALGLALTHKDFGFKTENGLLGFWSHSSKDSPYSARAIYNFTKDTDGKDMHFGQFIFIPHAAGFTGKYGAEYFTDRRALKGEEPFSMNITPLSVSSIQPIPLMDRTPKGLAFLLAGRQTKTKTSTTDNFIASVSYTGKLENQKYLSGMIDYNFVDNGLIKQQTLSPRVKLDLGRFEVGARYTVPLNSQTKSALFLEAQLDF